MDVGVNVNSQPQIESVFGTPQKSIPDGENRRPKG
jgi:hypothetical protein